MATSPPAHKKREAVKKSVKKMKSSLRDVYQKILDHLVLGDTQRVRSRYEIGRQITKVKRSPVKYGERAVIQLAAALGAKQSTLYHYADVADQWEPREFSRLCKKRDDVYGRPLSWSHLVEIAGVADSAVRNQLVEAVMSEGLTVRELRDRKAEILGHKASKTLMAPWHVTMHLGEVVEISRVLLDKAKAWEKTVFAALEEVGANDNPEAVLSGLEQAETSQREMRDLCKQNLKKMAAQKTRLNDVLASKRSRKGRSKGLKTPAKSAN
jgi:hypothetical protein